MCSHTQVSYSTKKHEQQKKMDVTVADIWLSERGYLSYPYKDKKDGTLNVPKGFHTRKLLLDDPSEWLLQNNHVFLPVYHYTDMYPVDKWIYSWLQSKLFCQTPETMAPTTETLYNHFMEFSQMNRRDYRQKELTSDLYQRFPCVKRHRLRRRKVNGQGKSVVDIPRYEDCVSSFQRYVHQQGRRLPPWEV